MPAVSSSLEKIPQNPPISPALRPETIRHPDKRSKLENDATCGLKLHDVLIELFQTAGMCRARLAGALGERRMSKGCGSPRRPGANA